MTTIGSQLDAALESLTKPQLMVASFGFTGFKRLKIACRPGDDRYEVSFLGAILANASGNKVQINSALFYINPVAVGFNGLHAGSLSSANYGWHEIHVVSDGTNVGGILVPVGESPVYPEGYEYGEFAGYAQVFTVAPLDLSQSMQYDDDVVMQDRGVLPSTGVAASSANSAQTINVSAYVPPKARKVSGFMGGAPNRRMMMAVMTYPTNQGIPSDVGRRNANGPAWGTGDGFGMTDNFGNVFIENQTMYWKSGDTQDANILYLSGYSL